MSLPSTEPPALPYESPREKTWAVGTLVYDRRALYNVFFWMLWGDFCLMLMDSGVAPNLVTLQLGKQGHFQRDHRISARYGGATDWHGDGGDHQHME